LVLPWLYEALSVGSNSPRATPICSSVAVACSRDRMIPKFCCTAICIASLSAIERASRASIPSGSCGRCRSSSGTL
jgi:hypothetical protein